MGVDVNKGTDRSWNCSNLSMHSTTRPDDHMTQHDTARHHHNRAPQGLTQDIAAHSSELTRRVCTSVCPISWA